MSQDSIEVRTAVGAAGQDPDPGVARQLSELARALQADTSLEAAMNRIVHSARREIDGARWAAISEIVGRKVLTRAASDPVVAEIERAQYDAGDGPCLTSLREQVSVRADNLGREQRWPQFVKQARGFGVQSIMSVQLFVHDDNLGALNLYGDIPGAFDDDDESTAMLLASHAAIAMKGQEVQGNLRIALRNRDIIGQGKGILMERYKIDDAQAFDLLVASSQQSGQKLAAIAERLALTGELLVNS